MVATDIAARGIHVEDIGLVIHADPPAEHKAYLHRSGRTARAGATGVVITLQTAAQAGDVRALMRKAKVTPLTAHAHPRSALLRSIAGEPADPPAQQPAPAQAPTAAAASGAASGAGAAAMSAGYRRKRSRRARATSTASPRAAGGARTTARHQPGPARQRTRPSGRVSPAARAAPAAKKRRTR
jgi:superfamily II DNA/RNA helicase